LPRKGSFSFTLVDEHGVACHTERLYPDQYSRRALQAVIARLVAYRERRIRGFMR
jgi:hypothetical protein